MNRRVTPILLVILVVGALAPVILRPGYLLYPRDGQATDLTITHWPAVAFNVRSLRQDGQIPLWRTTIASGGPWAANPQSWLFYPAAWLFFLLPINLTFNLLLLAHLLLAALATYAFSRRALDLKPPGAALAGLAFALAPWLSGHLSAGHVNLILALSWLSVALFGAHQAATTGRLEGGMLAGVAWAAALLNHFQIAAFTVALTLAWFLMVSLRGESVAGKRRQLGLLLLMPGVALLLSAVLLVPLAEALPYVNRSTLTLDQAGFLSLPWTHLLTALIPTYGGEPEQVIYLGLPVALLAVVGLVLERDWTAWFLVIIAALAALFALGTHGPLFPVLVGLVPGLSWLRVPPRAWVLVAFSLALLAGRGLDALSRPRPTPTARRRVTLTGLVALAIGLPLAAGLFLLYQPPPLAAWSLAGFTVLTVAALLFRARALLRPGPFVLAMLILTAADLGLVHAAWTEMRAPEAAFAWGAETAAYLAEQPGRSRSYSPSYSLPQHTAIQHDLDLADGIDPIQLAHYADFLASAGGYEATGYSPTLPPILDDASAQPDAVRLGLLNVGYVVAGYPVEAEGLVLRERSSDTYVYQNMQSLPRAFIVPYANPPAENDVRLELPIDPVPSRITVHTPNRIVIEADLEAPGLLVLSEVWYPGWRAKASGEDVSILRVEGTLRGIYLDPGSYTVEFRYSPWTVWVGFAISGCTALAPLAYAGYRTWRRP
jgi:hypothetical protein